MIEIKDLTKSFDGVEVLSHISMTLEKERFMALLDEMALENDADEAYFGFRFAHIRVNYD